MTKRDSLSFKCLTNKMTINFDVFSAFMEDGIGWNVNDTSIIYMQRGTRATWRKAKFS
jgi:hypothetical protein